jgi:hypothetical protein
MDNNSNFEQHLRIHDLTLPQVRDGLSLLLLEVYCMPGVDYICHRVQRQLRCNEAASSYHHRTHKRMTLRKLRL